MTKNVFYEWDIEQTDKFGDIQNHDHSDKLSRYDIDDLLSGDLVLVCDTYFNAQLERSWAYVKNGCLPEYFLDADNRRTRQVPKRFKQELARNNLIHNTMR